MDGVRACQPVARNTGCSRNPHLRGRWPRAGTHWARQLRGGHATRSGAPCAAGLSRVCLLGIRCVRDAWLRMNEKKKKKRMTFLTLSLGEISVRTTPSRPTGVGAAAGPAPRPHTVLSGRRSRPRSGPHPVLTHFLSGTDVDSSSSPLQNRVMFVTLTEFSKSLHHHFLALKFSFPPRSRVVPKSDTTIVLNGGGDTGVNERTRPLATGRGRQHPLPRG